MFELIHTSAPRGLFGGSGYTTVAATTGIPEALRKALESLSGYEQVFDYGSPQFSANPVAFICQPIGQAAGKSWWVLSRISVADKDYTGRSNYLAHHLALEHHELPQAGPVVLAKAYPWQTTWAGEPRALPPRTVQGIPAFPAPAAAPAWTRAGLDAGWAGHLAEQARSRRGVIQLVYPPGVDPLALVADAVALLPPTERWDARFHTHTSRPRPEHAWAWFPSEGTGTTDLGHRPGVVHLGLRPACPGTGSLVDQARGKLPSHPVPGGPGLDAFPGVSPARQSMPVATATEAQHGMHVPAGSWNTPPVPPKAKVLGSILHWTAHGLLLVTVGVLAWFVVDGMVRIDSERKNARACEKEKDDACQKLKDANESIMAIQAFKDSLYQMNGFSDADWKDAGGKALLISPEKSALLKDFVLKKKDADLKEIKWEQVLDEKYALEEKEFRIAKDDSAAIRDKNKKDNQSASELKKRLDEVTASKAMLEKNLAELKAMPGPIEWNDFPKSPIAKEGPIDIRFQLGPVEHKWYSESARTFPKDPALQRSLMTLALGLKPKEYFPVRVLRKHAEEINGRGIAGDAWWKNVFDKMNDMTGGKREGLPASAVSLLLVVSAVDDLVPAGSTQPFQQDPSSAAWFRQVDLLRKNDVKALRNIRSKLEALDNR